MLIGPTCEKAHFLFLFCGFSNSLFSRATGLNSSDKVSLVMSLSITFFVNVIYCIFDQSFTHPIDRKYRSATAPLVDIFNLDRPLRLEFSTLHISKTSCTSNSHIQQLINSSNFDFNIKNYGIFR